MFLNGFFISFSLLCVTDTLSWLCFARYRKECELVRVVHGEDGFFVVVEWSGLQRGSEKCLSLTHSLLFSDIKFSSAVAEKEEGCPLTKESEENK